MSEFKKISSQDITFFRSVVGEQGVTTEPEALKNYSRDETPDPTLRRFPEVVIKPHETTEIQAIMHYCSQNTIAVTPRGAGSGLSGGAIPARGGVVLSLERMNRILEVDHENLMVVVEPGVITNEINRKLKPYHLFYAGYPMSLETCQIGGNIAENAGGGKAVKYGVTGTYVRGVEFVTASGELLKFGGKIFKDVSSYDIVHLLVGSEGTLGIVTRIYLKVLPLPRARAVLLAPFDDPAPALHLPVTILSEMGMTPASIEYMNHLSLEYGYRFSNHTYPFPEASCHILLEIDGQEEEVVYREYDCLGERLFQEGAKEVFVADNAVAIEDIWRIRRAIPEALHLALPQEINEDISVPVASIPELVTFVEHLGQEFHLISPIYGHLGDGNLHITLAGSQNDQWEEKEPLIHECFYSKVASLGGVLSGEHGVGFKRRKYLPYFYHPEEINLLRRLKAAFDPQGILNPDKVLPD
ncbi:MAG: FAD-binding oxidoreductase [Atribacterota bacterium]|nr:FAD-binding oxidoreductase [Candidatus Atribacteria bacterium]